MIAAFLIALTMAPGQAAASGAVGLGQAQSVMEIDSSKIKGEPLRLAWSPDGTELFLMSAERDRTGSLRPSKIFLVSLAKKSLKGIDEEPAWASKYWTWKSAQISPAAPDFRISVAQDQRTVRSVAAPTGGALARGGTADPMAGTTVSDAATAASTAQIEQVYTLKVKGDVIGEWVNQPVVPGINFGWAPAPRRLMVYAKPDGGPLMTLDDHGNKTELAGAKNAVLPAFSEDGTRLAWLEKRDKKHYDLMIAAVTVK
ncbi:MAG: hypothetical protein ACM3SQ_11860 [Betaproteobacteria bacterium]